MKLIFLLAELIALVVLTRRRSPFVVFKLYLAVSILAGVFWKPQFDSAEWTAWLLIFESIRLPLQAATVAEIAYHVTTRIFPAERRRIAYCLTIITAVVMAFLWTIPTTTIGSLVQARQYVRVGCGIFALGGCVYFYRRPVAGLWEGTRQHCLMLAVFYSAGAVINVADRFIQTNSAWNLANAFYLAAATVCMTAWALFTPRLPRPSRIEPLQFGR